MSFKSAIQHAVNTYAEFDDMPRAERVELCVLYLERSDSTWSAQIFHRLPKVIYDRLGELIAGRLRAHYAVSDCGNDIDAKQVARINRAKDWAEFESRILQHLDGLVARDWSITQPMEV